MAAAHLHLICVSPSGFKEANKHADHREGWERLRCGKQRDFSLPRQGGLEGGKKKQKSRVTSWERGAAEASYTLSPAASP